jgi:putative Mg2+ transporter-C (MgtC) family protein
MLLANLLLGTTGKTADSYVQLDMMRLPLGILTGMGFCGGSGFLDSGIS